jgi:hypothetical protein
MIREIRLFAYFVIGVLLSAVVVVPAYAGTMTYSAPSTLVQTPSPTFASNGGSVVWASPINQIISSGRQPVTINMVATRVVQPATVSALAKGLLRGGVQGYVVMSALRTAVELAGIECNSEGCSTLPVAASTQPGTAVGESASVLPWQISNSYTMYGSSPVAMCNAFYSSSVATAAFNSTTGNWACKINGAWMSQYISPNASSRCYTGDPGTARACGAQSGYTCEAGYTLSGSTCSRPAIPSSPVSDSQLDPVLAGLGDGIKRDIVKESVEKGVPVDAGPQVVTGPASVTSPPMTTTNNSGGNTTVTTNSTTVNTTYAGDTINYHTVNNTTTTVNGVPASSTAEEAPDDPDDQASVVDASMPEQPKLYERKYPDGFSGVWATQSAAMKSTPLFGLSALFTPSIGGGSCPSWTINANIGPHMNYGSGSVSPPCWLWGALKAVLIISALLISRRLVFGG